MIEVWQVQWIAWLVGVAALAAIWLVAEGVVRALRARALVREAQRDRPTWDFDVVRTHYGLPCVKPGCDCDCGIPWVGEREPVAPLVGRMWRGWARVDRGWVPAIRVWDGETWLLATPEVYGTDDAS